MDYYEAKVRVYLHFKAVSNILGPVKGLHLKVKSRVVCQGGGYVFFGGFFGG